MEELLIELDGYMAQADLLHGVHSRVIAKKIYSGNMIRQYRAGERNLEEKKAKKLLRAYEIEVGKVKKKLMEQS